MLKHQLKLFICNFLLVATVSCFLASSHKSQRSMPGLMFHFCNFNEQVEKEMENYDSFVLFLFMSDG